MKETLMPTIEDPSKGERVSLVEELKTFIRNEVDQKCLEKFEKGVFMIPSETLNKVNELIDLVENEKTKDDLRQLLINILDQA